MKVADFNFSLPENLIAKRPQKERISSRLLVLHRDGLIEHKWFSALPSYLNKGDMLLINNTKVFPARLTGFKQNGGKLEILLIKKKEIIYGKYSQKEDLREHSRFRMNYI
jgi:S-adenosylmethionine:tRNA ribosyltransferase-isomerase